MPKPEFDELIDTEFQEPDLEIRNLENTNHQTPVIQEKASTPKPKKAKMNGQKPLYRQMPSLILFAIVLIVGSLLGVRYYGYASTHESTDDAFIEGHVIPIGPKVAGNVLKVYVSDNQEVKVGDVLVELDARDFESKLAQKKAALETAQGKQQTAQINVGWTSVTSTAGVQQASSGVDGARAQAAAAQKRIEQARAQIETAQANLEQARAQVTAVEADAARDAADVKRYQQLYDKDEISQQQLERTIAAHKASTAQLDAARRRVSAAEAQVTEARAAQQMAAETLKQAQAQIGEAQARLTAAQAAPQQVAMKQSEAKTSDAEVEKLKAEVSQAELELSYTKVFAPQAGRVTRKAVEAGSYLQVGQTMLAIVPSDLWITANFKETQLTYLRPGQPVEIKVDTYPNKIFKGHVDSIQMGTGARFSLLPPENATGNYIKVVQRVPVKIVFDEPFDAQHPLGPGMSVSPEVKVN